MYATPVVDGNTVVPVRRPPGSMTQRARFGRSPRASRSRSTSDRAPSMSTRTTLIVSESTTRKRPRHLPRPLMLPAPKTLLDRARLEGGLGAAVAGHLHFNDGTGRRGCSTGGRRGRRSLRLVLVLVALLTAGERADGHDRREQSEAHCGTPPRHGLRGCVACELFHNREYRRGSPKREPHRDTSF